MLLVEKTFRIKKERKKKKETKRFKNRRILEKTTCKYISSPSRKID